MTEFHITDEIKALGVSKVVIVKDYLYVYNGNTFAQSRHYKNELQKTLIELQDNMVNSGRFGDQKTVEKIIFLLSNIYVDAQEKRASEQQKDKGNGRDKGKQKQESFRQVYRSPVLWQKRS